MVCVRRQDVYCLIFLFISTVNGAAQTTISCGDSGGVVGQPLVLSCNISGIITQDIYWYRYNTTYNANIVQCFKSSAESIGTCVAPPPLRYLYNVSTEPQPPKQPSFTIISVSAEDLVVSWVCVDSITFPGRDSINENSSCSLKQGSDSACSNCSCSLIGGLAFICDFVFGLAASTLITFVIETGLSTPLKIGVFVVPAVASGILGGGSYGACLVLVSIGGIVGINIACMLVVVAGTYVVVKFFCK